ncbi:hypothetical protein QBC44DRAFT_313126 [Cladorrhinum sp. PSN332]|nr:hypothetical protein QBC44DRAFT_313126 [Cladorrhinum sp. PSN332]
MKPIIFIAVLPLALAAPAPQILRPPLPGFPTVPPAANVQLEGRQAIPPFVRPPPTPPRVSVPPAVDTLIPIPRPADGGIFSIQTVPNFPTTRPSFGLPPRPTFPFSADDLQLVDPFGPSTEVEDTSVFQLVPGEESRPIPIPAPVPRPVPAPILAGPGPVIPQAPRQTPIQPAVLTAAQGRLPLPTAPAVPTRIPLPAPAPIVPVLPSLVASAVQVRVSSLASIASAIANARASEVAAILSVVGGRISLPAARPTNFPALSPAPLPAPVSGTEAAGLLRGPAPVPVLAQPFPGPPVIGFPDAGFAGFREETVEDEEEPFEFDNDNDNFP